MNLELFSNPGTKPPSFVSFARAQVQKGGFGTLYQGLGAGTTRQIFYATSRFGLFEVYRDFLKGTSYLSPAGEVEGPERVLAGLGVFVTLSERRARCPPPAGRLIGVRPVQR